MNYKRPFAVQKTAFQMAKDDGGRGYGMPLNYVWDGADALYIHCAPDG